MLAIGASLVEAPERTFYAELQPVTRAVQADALRVSGLSLDALAATGRPPEEAMAALEAWVEASVGDDRPIFVGFNAPFDWMFVNDYFHRFLGRKPFAHAALDIKSFHMGRAGVAWAETSLVHVAAAYGMDGRLSHNAMEDARFQAALFARMLAAPARRPASAESPGREEGEEGA